MTRAWVFSNFTDTTNYTNPRLISALESRGSVVKFVDYGKITTNARIDFQTDDISIFYDDGEELLAPDLVIFSNSIPNFGRQPNGNLKVSAVASYMKKWTNTVFVNEIDPHLRYSSKHAAYETLLANNVPIPPTITIDTTQPIDSSIRKIEQEIGLPCVLKPTAGYSGKGVGLCNNVAELTNKLNDLITNIPNDYVCAQKFLPEVCGLMYTVRVIGDQFYPGVILGSPYSTDRFQSDNQPNRKHIACVLDSALEKICRDAMNALNLDTARLDVFLTSEGYKICEVNVAGNFNRTDTMCCIDEASLLVDYALKKLVNRV